MEEWQPLKGFNRPETRSNVLVIYYKTVIQPPSESEDKKVSKEAPSDEVNDTTRGASKADDTKEDSANSSSEDGKKEEIPPPEEASKGVQEESEHPQQDDVAENEEQNTEVGVIDEAFASRIHVPLFYPALDERSTKKIWENSLKKIKHNNKNADIAIKFDKDTLLDYAVQHFRENTPPPGEDTPSSAWNGRQIRNAFQTALALAHYDRIEKIRRAGASEAEAGTHKRFKKAELKRRHFEQVATITKNYYDYLKDAHGGKAFEEQAVFNEERADWQPEGSTQQVPRAMPMSGFPAARGFGMLPTRPAVNQQSTTKDETRAFEGKKEKRKKKSDTSSSSSDETPVPKKEKKDKKKYISVDTEGTKRKDKQKKKREPKKETSSEESDSEVDSSSESSSSGQE